MCNATCAHLPALRLHVSMIGQPNSFGAKTPKMAQFSGSEPTLWYSPKDCMVQAGLEECDPLWMFPNGC